MFLMSKQQWDKCFGSLREDEIMSSQDFDFERFKKEYEYFIKSQNINKKLVNYSLQNFLKKIPYLNECYNKKIIKYIGKGSSRIVFAFSDGKALKCALNKAGIAQNKTEITNIIFNSEDHYACFPMIYDYNDEYLFMITDCCRKIVRDDMQKLYKTNFENFINFLVNLISIINDSKKFEDIDNIDVKYIAKTAIENETEYAYSIANQYNKRINSILLNKNEYKYSDKEKNDKINALKKYIKQTTQDTKNFVNFVKLILSKKSFSADSIRALLQFYIDIGEEHLIVGDIKRKANWGILRRKRSDAAVIIDVGFSEDVYDKYYMHR